MNLLSPEPQHLSELRSEQGGLQLAQLFNLVLGLQQKGQFQSENTSPRSLSLCAALSRLEGSGGEIRSMLPKGKLRPGKEKQAWTESQDRWNGRR